MNGHLIERQLFAVICLEAVGRLPAKSRRRLLRFFGPSHGYRASNQATRAEVAALQGSAGLLSESSDRHSPSCVAVLQMCYEQAHSILLQVT